MYGHYRIGLCYDVLFFFFKQKTAYEMRISDWSSDVCSSDLLSSTLHLGRPERAWRALSQWRSSWLSREGVAAIVTFLPVGLFALCWVVAETNGGAAAAVGLLASLCCAVTVACTAMISASLKTIRAWCSAWTLPEIGRAHV